MTDLKIFHCRLSP